MSESDNNLVIEKIKADLSSHPIVVYMKGTKEEPMCGFSAQVVQILKGYGVDFKTINILEDWDLREGIKAFSSWPTIPQVYVKGKFIGGCDITSELHRKGELEAILRS